MLKEIILPPIDMKNFSDQTIDSNLIIMSHDFNVNELVIPFYETTIFDTYEAFYSFQGNTSIIIQEVYKQNNEIRIPIVNDVRRHKGIFTIELNASSNSTQATLLKLNVMVKRSNIDSNSEFLFNHYYKLFEDYKKEIAELNNATQATIKTQLKQSQDNLQKVSKTLVAINDKVMIVNDTADGFMLDVETKQADVTSKYNAFDMDITEANQTIDELLALQPQFQSVLDETAGKEVISAPEIILARGGEANLKARLDKDQQQVTAQLAQTSDNAKSNSTYYSMPRKPMGTFVDDDGHVDVYTRLYPIFSEKGVKGNISIITSAIDTNNSLTSAHLDELYDDGWGFLGHGHSYAENLSEFTNDADLEYQLGEGCKTWLEDRGYLVNGFVYPQGVSDERIRRFTKKYYDFAFQGDKFNDGEFIDTTRIRRIAFGSWTSTNPTVNGNSEKNTLAYYKECVDYAAANNIWLVFMTHIGQQDISQDPILSDLIDYMQSVNVEIVTALEGYKAFGNKVFVGDKDSDYVVINEEGLYSNNVYPSKRIKSDRKYLTDGINTYSPGITVMNVTYWFASANGFPGNSSGTLITYRFNGDYAFYNKQEYLQSDSNKKHVRYALTDTTWSAFEEIITSASLPYKMSGLNAYTAADPITKYPAKTIMTFPVNFNGSTGFAPTQSAGVVTVYRIHGNGWDRREFRKHNSNEIYSSYTDGSTGEWSAPVKISAV